MSEVGGSLGTFRMPTDVIEDMSADSSSKKGNTALIINEEDIRIVLVGKSGAGKSATGNTILGSEAFESEFSMSSCTKNCQKVTGVVAGRKVSLVDTPGLFDTTFSKEQTLTEIKQSICFAAPGPHVFLNVIKLGRFTEEEGKSVELIQETFGEMSNNYSMILFTNGDQLDGKSVEDILKNVPQLEELMRKCERRHHVFNNKTKDPSQVTELLKKINNMVLKNGRKSHYTNEMFQRAEKAIEEEMQRILKNNENKRSKEEEKLKKEHERDSLKKTEKIKKERQEQEAKYTRDMKERRRTVKRRKN